LRAAALSARTRASYKRQIRVFQNFLRTTYPRARQFPTPEAVGWFVCHLAKKGLQASTVRCYVSALAYWAQDMGEADPGESFRVKQLLRGLERKTAAPDTRTPISLGDLRSLVTIVPQLTCEPFEVRLFKAMFTTAFYGFLRVGEMTSSGRGTAAPALSRKSAVLDAEQLKLTISEFKHNQGRKPHTVIINERPGDAACPVERMEQYLEVRGDAPGPLFMLRGKEVKGSVFAGFLKRACAAVGLDPKTVKPHSFRIGAATNAMDAGCSDAQIRRMGRWKSSAFLAYLRPVV
jgi:site-specific recombinase XerD